MNATPLRALLTAQEAGASPMLELAFTIADGLEYLRCAQRAGLTVDQARRPAWRCYRI